MSQNRIWRWTVICSLGLLVALLAVGSRASAQDQAAGTSQASGLRAVPGKVMGTAAPSVVRDVDVSALPQLVAPQAPQAVRSVPVLFPEGAAAHQARVNQVLSETGRLAPTGNNGPTAVTEATPGASVGFGGLDENCSGLTPSDMGLAVNQSFVVQVINSCILVTNKSGVVQTGFPKSLGSFVGCTSCFLFDPRLTYDWAKNHFILVIDSSQGGFSTIWVAASATSNPTGVWHISSYTFDSANGDFADYPTLGFDPTAIYIGFNDFLAAGGFTNELWILNKTKIEGGLATSPAAFSGFGICSTTCAPVDTLQPVNVYNPNDQPRAEYMVNSFNGSTAGLVGCGSSTTPCDGLILWAISSPLSGPSFSGVIVGTPSSYVFPTPATQPGCTTNTTGCMIETLDLRISGNVYYNHGSFYPTLETSIGGGENSTLTWEIEPQLSRAAKAIMSGAVVAKESGYFTGGANLRCTGSAIFGDAIPDSEGNLTMGFGFTSTCDNPTFAYVTQRVSEVPFATTWGQGDGGIDLVGGAGVYTGGACSSSSCTQRWGDYSSGSPDLQISNKVAMWFSGMFAEASGIYGTVIGKNGYTSPTQP
ncbi:MAG TPA: hypothetical protein VGT03_07210 [Candidatus Acidoferrales bacterium]|nr:hypothetical protein [Candidatus Acidoferrales bacterium]